MNHHQKGTIGESAAAEFLQKQGHRVLIRNFRIPGAEVDLITQKEDRYHFIEVKKWDVFSDLDIEYAVDRRKVARILRAGMTFLKERGFPDSDVIQVDLIFIGSGGSSVRYLENIQMDVE